MTVAPNVVGGFALSKRGGARAFLDLPESLVPLYGVYQSVSEWIARVYREEKGYRVVVEGLLDFEVENLDRVEARTAAAILERLRMSYPTCARPWEDPSAERVMEFEVQVAPVAGGLR